MEVHQLKCPNCNANLEVENGLDTFYCNYCGTKLIVDHQSDSMIRAKVDIKKAEIEAERERQKQQHIENKIKLDNDNDKLFYKVIGAILGVVILAAIIMSYFLINSGT